MIKTNNSIDNILGISLPEKTQEKIEKLPKIKNFLRLFQKNLGENEYAKTQFKEEVLSDLEKIKEFKKIYSKGLVIIPFEGDSLINNYQKIKSKYEKNYCPCTFFNKFSKSNKIQYMILRMQIDKELKIKNNTYIM